MKTYEKPRLVALSLQGNESLCASCDMDINDQTVRKFLAGIGISFPDINNDGRIDSAELDATGLFDVGACKKSVDQFCKFTGSGTKIAWS